MLSPLSGSNLSRILPLPDANETQSFSAQFSRVMNIVSQLKWNIAAPAKNFALGSLFRSYLLPVFFLAGCAVNTTDNEGLIPDCSGSNCGAEGSQYKGSGLGVWTYENKGKKPKALKVSLSGLEHNKVTLVFSNLSEHPQSMPKGLVNRGGTKDPAFPNYQPNLLDPIPTDVSHQRLGSVERKTWKVPQMGKNNQADKPIDFPSTLRGEATIGQFT
ncbi:hypothetical protein Rin_00017320 [Candidatus Regiella insecticola 5.15]|uniref:Uncharacterized protein n=1 Tax=Candidatus Regiella insecticola 5.15 TaxID=1005043 RepID=G2H0Z7_9ENTR|nr:hypothetical protein [Candidatus Regiella insecticola]EGY28327.1 hypothetical protein Rin_00017320 [Candidatus Regiella insecticola 5.15]